LKPLFLRHPEAPRFSPAGRGIWRGTFGDPSRSQPQSRRERREEPAVRVLNKRMPSEQRLR